MKYETTFHLRRLKEVESRLQVALSVLPADYIPIILSSDIKERLGPQIVAEYEAILTKMWNKMKPNLVTL